MDWFILIIVGIGSFILGGILSLRVHRRFAPRTTQVIEHEDHIRVEYTKNGLNYEFVIPRGTNLSHRYLLLGIDLKGQEHPIRFPQGFTNQATVQQWGFQRMLLKSRIGEMVRIFEAGEVPSLDGKRDD